MLTNFSGRAWNSKPVAQIGCVSIWSELGTSAWGKDLHLGPLTTWNILITPVSLLGNYAVELVNDSLYDWNVKLLK